MCRHSRLCSCETDPPFADYRETAAKLQQEWRVKAPHHSFDFSHHVNNYALTTLLNKGLIYEDYQRQFAESQHQQVCPTNFPLSLFWVGAL